MNSWTSQHDTYLKELHKAYASLHEVHKALDIFNLSSSTSGGQLMYVSRTLGERSQDLESSHRRMEFLRIQNVSLAIQLKDSAFVNLRTVLVFFINALGQVEHFHLSVVGLFREIKFARVRLLKMVKLSLFLNMLFASISASFWSSCNYTLSSLLVKLFGVLI